MRRTVRRKVPWPSWLLIAVAALFFAVGLELPRWAEYAPFALSFVLFGLPRGAVDHLAVGLLYLVLGGLYLALWFVAPVAAFAFFIALTWFHWGTGDLHALVAFTSGESAYPVSRTHRFLVPIVRGGLPSSSSLS